MTAISAPSILLGVVVAGAVLAAIDLQRAQQETLVVYTSPALKDLFELDLVPRYLAQTGQTVSPVYVAAGEQYNRLRMSGDEPEADVFVHASPLFLEKGYDEGYFEKIVLPEAEANNVSFRSREVNGGRIWYTFAWSPLVEVYATRLDAPPDLATSNLTYGLAHPLLSNNGIYNVLYFEELDPEAGRHALARTTVQPVNARSSINGVADGSFDVTLGYEAVTLLYQDRGASVAMALPNLRGERHVVEVLVSVGLVRNHPHDEAYRFIRFLFTNETQANLGKYHFRSVVQGAAPPDGGVDVTIGTRVPYDWADWRELEDKLKDHEVRT